ncbi:MAG TPA: GNAT family N-acetyltransferase [Thermomicrobiales bacterium]|nr:GNAT family N-acetyltransferase [Thermomicrobiales bacterium]
MKLRRYRDAREFEAVTRDFLLRDEAANCLILGITGDLLNTTLYSDYTPYLVTVELGGEIVAAALRTPPHNLQLSLAPPEAAALLAADALQEHADLPGVQGTEEAGLAFAREWARITGQRYQPGIPQRIYALEAVTPPAGVPGELRPATLEESDLLLDWLMAFEVAIHGGAPSLDSAARRLSNYFSSSTRGLYVWHDGGPVSMAGYGGPTPNGIRVGPVYTPPEHRQRGYASAATASVSQLLLDGGYRHCFLFTDRDNATTNHIYQEIGYRPVVDVNEYRFVGAPREA